MNHRMNANRRERRRKKKKLASGSVCSGRWEDTYVGRAGSDMEQAAEVKFKVQGSMFNDVPGSEFRVLHTVYSICTEFPLSCSVLK